MALNVTRSPVAVNAQYGLKTAGEQLEQVSYKFATGERYSKPSQNLFATVESSMGKARLTYTESALANLTRLRSILATRNGALQTMISGVQKLSDIALQASGTLPAEVRAANIGVFQQVMARVENLAQTAEYAGIKLLNGSFGGKKDFLESNSNVKNSRVVAIPGAPGAATIRVPVPAVTSTITLAGVPAAGDAVTIGNATFTFVDNPNGSEFQVAIGADADASARNLLEAIKKSKADGVKQFSYTIAGASITATRLSTSLAPIGNEIASNNANADVVAGVNGNNASVEMSSLTIPGPTGRISNFQYTDRSEGNGPEQALGGALRAAIGNRIANNTTPATPGAGVADMWARYTFSIGTEDYVGYIYKENAANTLNLQMLCTKVEDDPRTQGTAGLAGKVFAINLAAAADITDHANAAAVAADLNVDAGRITFKQQNYMSVDASGGDIKVNGVAIGTVTDLNATLLTDSFDKLNVTDVTASANGIDITINNGSADKVFHVDYPVGGTWNAGEAIVLTHAASGDELTLSLGMSYGLDISTPDNQQAVSLALKNALSPDKGSTFIVGTDVSQKLTVKLGNMDWDILTKDQRLTIEDADTAQIAVTTLSAIINALNAEVGTTAAYDSAVDSLVEQMSVSQQNLASAIEALTSIDIADTRQQLDVALRVYNSCIASMSADQRANQLLDRLLELR